MQSDPEYCEPYARLKTQAANAQQMLEAVQERTKAAADDLGEDETRLLLSLTCNEYVPQYRCGLQSSRGASVTHSPCQSFT